MASPQDPIYRIPKYSNQLRLKPTELVHLNYAVPGFSQDELIRSFFEVARKKSKHNRIVRFKYRLGTEIKRLSFEIAAGIYMPATPHTFKRWCSCGQKYRKIVAPSVADLIVQWTLYKRVYPVIDATLIDTNFGCRRQGGYQKAAFKTTEFLREMSEDAWYLQIDVSKYYYSIQKDILYNFLKNYNISKSDLKMLRLFLQEHPIAPGSILAQLFGLVYLNEFDHHVINVLGHRRYIRYVDDMVFICRDKQEAIYLLNYVTEYFKTNLKIHLSHWKYHPIKSGVDFCGYINYRSVRLLRKRSKKAFSKSLRERDWDALESRLAHAIYTANYSNLIKRLKLAIEQDKYTYNPPIPPAHILKRISDWDISHYSHL